MPSPIGHALAGLATAWALEPVRLADPPRTRENTSQRHSSGRRLSTLAWICAGLAVAPDLDLVYLPIHRTATHSLTAVLLVMIIAIAVTGWVNRRVRWRIVAACTIAYGSHVLLDWLGADASRPYGIQMFWPFSDRWVVSPWTLFPGTERRAPFSARSIQINLTAAVVEVLVLGTIALVARRSGRSGGSDGSGRAGRQGG